MKLKTLTLTIVATGLMSTQTGAVYNLYKQNGLSLDINGEVNVAARNLREQLDVQYTDATGTSLYANTTWARIAQGAYVERADRRTRLGQDDGASWMEVRGSQLMNNDWRVTGTIGFGYYDSGTGGYLSNANMAIDKINVGSLSIGRQYLHTGYVTRTGTYTPLETFAGASARVDYTQIPNLHLSGYYNTPSSSDVRTNSTAEVEGWGLSASYRYPIADNHSIRGAIGYSDSRANPSASTREGNNYAVDAEGLAGSLEYRYGNFLAAVDAGKKEEDMNGTVIDSAESNFVGAKLGYQLTPKFSMTVGYGKKETKRTNQDGVPLTATYIAGTTLSNYHNLVTVYESFLFDKVEEEKAYIRGDYYLRDNVRLYGRVDKEEIQTKLNGQDFAKFDNTGYRLGVAFTF